MSCASVRPRVPVPPRPGGRLFVREVHGGERARRLPIRQLFGPAIPNEMLKGPTEVAFVSTVEGELQGRLAHEIEAVLKGYAPRV
jgi:hypothetical protein